MLRKSAHKIRAQPKDPDRQARTPSLICKEGGKCLEPQDIDQLFRLLASWLAQSIGDQPFQRVTSLPISKKEKLDA